MLYDFVCHAASQSPSSQSSRLSQTVKRDNIVIKPAVDGIRILSCIALLIERLQGEIDTIYLVCRFWRMHLYIPENFLIKQKQF